MVRELGSESAKVLGQALELVQVLGMALAQALVMESAQALEMELVLVLESGSVVVSEVVHLLQDLILAYES